MEDHEHLKFLITGKRIYLINSSNTFNFVSNKVGVISISRQSVSLKVDGGRTQTSISLIKFFWVKLWVDTPPRG